MFEMFVIGPVATSELGLIGRCIDCARGASSRACPGFGEGCLAPTRPALDAAETAGAAPRL